MRRSASHSILPVLMLLSCQQALADCHPVPTGWKLGQPWPIKEGQPANNPAPALKPGENAVYFTESGTSGSTWWQHEGAAVIRDGCVVWQTVFGFADGELRESPAK